MGFGIRQTWVSTPLIAYPRQVPSPFYIPVPSSAKWEHSSTSFIRLVSEKHICIDFGTCMTEGSEEKRNLYEA